LFKQLLLEVMTPLGDQFYKSGDETRSDFVALVKKATSMDPDLTLKILLLSRKAKYKAPALLGAHFLPSAHRKALLSQFPIDMLYKFLELHRTQGFTLGSKKKRSVAEVLETKPIEWNALQALKKRKKMRAVLKVTHPRPPNDQYRKLWGWALRRVRPPIGVELIDKAHEVKQLARRREFDEAARLAAKCKLPFTLIASLVPEDVLARHLELYDTMTAFDKGMFGRLVVSWFEDGLDRIAREAAIDYALRAIDALVSEEEKVRYLKILANRLAKEALEDAFAKLVRGKKGALVLDFSCSMSSYFSMNKLYALAFSRLLDIDKVVAFPETTPMWMSVDEVLALTTSACGGTPLYEAVRMALEENPDFLIVVTDEQENASDIDYVPSGKPIVVINPTTYRAHYMQSAMVLPGRPSGLIEALRFVSITEEDEDRLMRIVEVEGGESIRFVSAYQDPERPVLVDEEECDDEYDEDSDLVDSPFA